MPEAWTREDESVASFFRRRFGPSSVDLIAQPLLGGIHAGDIEQLSMRALFPRLLDAERTGGSVLRAVRSRPACLAGIDAFSDPFVALRNGMGSLVEALERTLPPRSDQLPASVDRVTHDTRGWHVTSGPETFDARAIIFAAPASALATLFAPLDASAARICSAGALRLHREHRSRLAGTCRCASLSRHRLRRRTP